MMARARAISCCWPPDISQVRGTIAGQADGFQRFIDGFGNHAGGLLGALLAQTIADIFGHGQMRKQGIVLEHHVYRTAIGGQVVDPLTIQQHLARCGRLESRQYAQGGGVATAGRAQKRQKFAPPDRQIQVIGGDKSTKALGRPAKFGNRSIGLVTRVC